MADEKKAAAAKHKVRNVSDGPRFFHNDAGNAVTLDPGQEWEGPVDIKQFERRDSAGVEFQIDGKASKVVQQAVKSDQFDVLSDVQLRDAVQKRDPKKPLAANLTREELLELARE